MPWYKVTISRTETATAEFEVEAPNEEAAELEAMDLACNYAFDRAGEADYEVEDVEETV